MDADNQIPNGIAPAADAQPVALPEEEVRETKANEGECARENVLEVQLDAQEKSETQPQVQETPEVQDGEEGESEAQPVGLNRYALPNDEDTIEGADEIGVSGVYDVYGREIIPDVFENRLRLSPNPVKLAYSRLKNLLLSFEGIKRRYVGKGERFYVGAKPIVIFAIRDASLVVTVDDTSIKVRKEKGAEGFQKALDLVSKATESLTRKENYIPVAYAERYPFAPETVLQGHEDDPPEDLAVGTDYDPIEGELTKNVIDELMGEDFSLAEKWGEEKLKLLRQQATTVRGAVALTEPIVFFYGVARDKENEIAYVELFQVLNDKFLGKMLPQQFIAVAEGSERIEFLNLMSVERAARTADENPSLTVLTTCSARLLIKPAVFKRLLKAAQNQHGNLVLAFDCALLEALGTTGVQGIRALTDIGVRIMMDNSENAGLKVLTEYGADWFRFDARWFVGEDPKKMAYLDTVASYASVLGLKTSASNVDTVKAAQYLLSHGVGAIGGNLVGTPQRLVSAAIKSAKRLPTV